MTIKEQKGSFLLEFLIALAIFSVAIVGLVKLQNRSISDLGDLGSNMSIPILIDDFTARINLTEDGSELTNTDKEELEETAKTMLKTVEFVGDTITIIDMNNPDDKRQYTVVLDSSRLNPVANDDD